MKFEIPKINCTFVGSNAKRFGRRQRKARNLTKSPDPADLPKDVDVKRTEILFAERTDRPTATLAWPDASRIYITLIFFMTFFPSIQYLD